MYSVHVQGSQDSATCVALLWVTSALMMSSWYSESRGQLAAVKLSTIQPTSSSVNVTAISLHFCASKHYQFASRVWQFSMGTIITVVKLRIPNQAWSNFKWAVKIIFFYPTVTRDSGILENTGTYHQIFWSPQIDQGLILGDHVDWILAKVTSEVYALRNLAKLRPLKILKVAYFGLVYPHLQYSIVGPHI